MLTAHSRTSVPKSLSSAAYLLLQNWGLCALPKVTGSLQQGWPLSTGFPHAWFVPCPQPILPLPLPPAITEDSCTTGLCLALEPRPSRQQFPVVTATL